MCGICGFFGKKKNKREIVEKMKEKLVHRGPDAQGSFVNDSVALGFRRLSIIDLEGGLQPMKSSSQNLTVVFNGEIYNYQELREQMEREKKILFVTRSDTETLVNGLEAYGPAFVEQLRGMFAFAVWNEKKEELMLARDFFGIKPLFYTVVDGNFVFASEIKSILQFPGVPKKLNERALEQYLSFQYSVLEETFFEGIYRLPPGCMLFYRQGKYEICRYFQPKLQPEAGCSLADMEKKLESVLKKSVRRHMVSDVEVGTFLSGGVDCFFRITCSFFRIMVYKYHNLYSIRGRFHRYGRTKKDGMFLSYGSLYRSTAAAAVRRGHQGTVPIITGNGSVEGKHCIKPV